MTPALTLTEPDSAHAAMRQLQGPLDLSHLTIARKLLKPLEAGTVLDLSSLTRLDTAGAMILAEFVRVKQGELKQMQPAHQTLYDLVAGAAPLPKKKANHWSVRACIAHFGRRVIDLCDATRELVTFLGHAVVTLLHSLAHPRRMRLGEIVHHIEEIGIEAIPIISLIAFLISVVLAYQSTEQLRPLGAEQFTVNLITISVLREMGVLLTAIMVAGRSGSAFAAEIGVMKVREEVDALRAIGLDPFEILVIPRIIALVLAMPLLVFVADVMGLLGGGILTMSLIGTTMTQYIDRVHTIGADGHALFVGMVKAPVFAFFIGVVGCMHGLKVTGSAESVGVETTASVVQSIFVVLMLDALFSIFFQQVGI